MIGGLSADFGAGPGDKVGATERRSGSRLERGRARNALALRVGAGLPGDALI